MDVGKDESLLLALCRFSRALSFSQYFARYCASSHSLTCVT